MTILQLESAAGDSNIVGKILKHTKLLFYKFSNYQTLCRHTGLLCTEITISIIMKLIKHIKHTEIYFYGTHC